jgi:DNA-binding FadR family transcriptional regulator
MGEKQNRVFFKPLRTRRAFEEISAEIKRQIFTGTLKPGERLPPEIELAAQFEVSRPTIREALRRLEIAGFISMQKGGTGGPLIVDTILNTISDSFLDAFLMKKMTTDDVTKARLKIEKMVLMDVFDAIDDQDIAALLKNVAESKKEVNMSRQAFEYDMQFHKLLAISTKNYVFVIIMEALMAVVAHFHSFLKIGITTSRKASVAHTRIVEAIEAGDRATALAALEKHILEVDRTYRSLANREAGQRQAGSESNEPTRQQ